MIQRSVSESGAAARERWIVAVVGGTLLVDSIFYTALTPLLPQFVHRLHMSAGAAGLLTACYAIGCLAGTIPSGLLAARIGPRATVLAGLTVVALTTAAFAFVDSPFLLDLARLLEGLGGSAAWSGGLAWVAGGTAPGRRGTVMGQVLAAATAGSLLGPAVGAAASSVGREIAFGAVAVLAASMTVVCRRVPAADGGGDTSSKGLTGALRDTRVLGTMWLIALPSLISGALSVLGSLRLHHLGAGPTAIGATFLVAAAIDAVVGPLSGNASDRYGRLAPVCVGLLAATVLLAGFGLPTAALPAAALIVAAAVGVEVLWAPAMAWLSEVLERRGDAAALAGALINLAWSGGQIAGSAGGGRLAQATDDVTPMIVAAGLSLATLLALSVRALSRGHRRGVLLRDRRRLGTAGEE
ncbi:MAG TPA: MFS transporter [Solirubrobacteraceae bacterium]|nr:MFS transporter [Solirubrobacteraceae bacterium]